MAVLSASLIDIAFSQVNIEGCAAVEGMNTEVLEIRSTAYSHSEADHLKSGRKNAIGSRLKYGRTRSAVADWSRYPLG